MDLLKKLKGVFIVEDTTAKPAEESGDVKQESVATSSSTVKIETPQTAKSTFDPSSLNGQPADQKFIDILFNAIEKANIDGFDYLEFKESLVSLSKVNMDETTRYKSALAMASTMNATPQKLVESANHYLSVLKNESDKFSEAVNNQKKKIDTDQTQGIANLKTSVSTKQQTILKLQQEIETEKAQLLKMESEISENINKVEETAAKFNKAYVLVSDQIVSDIKNINQFAN
jgi:hypothetical protein